MPRGSRPGERRGGRKKGTPNKATLAKVFTPAEIEEMRAGGQMPLDYMLSVMRNPEADQRRRDEFAKAAAPYCHPKVIAVSEAKPEQPPVKPRDPDSIEALLN